MYYIYPLYMYMYKGYNYKNGLCTPCVKKQGLSNAQIRCNLNSELCIR